MKLAMKKSFIDPLKLVSVIYWIFLTYMVAAFIWWYVSLEKQNDQITQIKIEKLQATPGTNTDQYKALLNYQERKRKQFLGEGITFLFLFFLGAIYVYRSLVKQLRYSNQQQNFMMAVTHELKTPIAVTQLNIETLLKRELQADQQKQLLNNSLKETQRLDALCNNILLAAQLDLADYQQNKQSIQLSEMVKAVIKSFEERFPARKMIVQVQEEVMMFAEPLLMQMLLQNLLDNANKYAPIETPIEVVLEKNDRQILLQVKDQGPGIPPAERERVFNKFYRMGNESTRSAKGTGLGLYLCKKIAEFHQSQLLISENQPQGTIFSFKAMF
ncbi:MAG: sensor histidine kinase [Sediminibacterium sp.]|jgi:K+-sensing histidine kinase KdpD